MSTIKACKNIYQSPITVVFQPHTYTRTKALMPEFLNCFDDAKNLIIAKTYAAREKSLKGGTAKDLVVNLSKSGKEAIYFNNFKKIKKYLLKTIDEKQIILILGAGDIEELARSM